MPSNLSVMLELAKRADSSRWSSANTLMAKWLAARKAGRDLLARRKLHSTRGGSSDTELNELQVRPTGWPSAPQVVMMATPVGNVPSARRNSMGSKAARAWVSAVIEYLPSG